MSTPTKTTLTVEGMTCNNCVRHVTQALNELPGVSSSHVDLGKGSATIEHADSVSHEALVAALADAGYTARVTPGA